MNKIHKKYNRLKTNSLENNNRLKNNQSKSVNVKN